MVTPRAALVEKHKRHIEDLQKYYESELAVLRREESHSSCRARPEGDGGESEKEDLEWQKVHRENERLRDT